MKNIEINGKKYELVRNDNDCFDKDVVLDKITDYFDDYDYIFGDYAYEKVRLKGFYDKTNKKVKKINNIEYLDEYIKNYCSYGAKTCLLKKVK